MARFRKIWQTGYLYKPYFFVFKFRILLAVMCRETFGRFHRRKFKKITNKDIKTVKNTNNNHRLLHLISLRGLCVNTNTKTAFKTKHL